MTTDFNEIEVMRELENGYEDAARLIAKEDKIERILQRTEKKLKSIPGVGDIFAILPVYISLIRYYVRREYTDIPIGTIIAIASAVLYMLKMIDLIPDFIPVAGYVDDAAVLTACVSMVKADVDEFVRWREATGRGLCG